MRTFIAIMVVAVAFAMGGGTVFAHAEPATITPGDGAVLTSPPAQIVITMTQEMFDREGANDIDVVDANGTEVTTVAAALDRNTRKSLTVALPSTLQPGVYSVKWKTLSAEDGDPADGALSFAYDPNGVATPGKVQIQEDILGNGSNGDDNAGEGPTLSVGGADEGVTWVLVLAVGLGMFVLGAGGTFLLVQKRP